MSHIAWQAAVKTSRSVRVAEDRLDRVGERLCTLLREEGFESACQVISSASTRLPGPSGSRRAMSIQFLKISRPVAPSLAAAQLITTDVVRSGYLPAKTIAIMPPIEVPWTWALSSPRASISPARSSAHTSMS